MLIPDPILLEICAYLTDYNKLLYLSCNKYLHRLKHVTWFDSNIQFKKIHKISYRDRFRAIIIEIFEIKYLADQYSTNYYDSEKFISLPNLQKLTIAINTNQHTNFEKILTKNDTLILNKLNIKILILELNILSKLNMNNVILHIGSKLPDSITIFKACNNIICEPKYLPLYLTELGVKILDSDLSHPHADIFFNTLEKITFLNYPLGDSFKQLKKISYVDNYYHTHLFIPEGVTCIKNIPRLQNISTCDKTIHSLVPSTVKKLFFSSSFNEKIEIGSLSNNLVELSFGHFFNQILHPGSLPNSIIKLYTGGDFNHKLYPESLPHNLKQLTFGTQYNKKIDNNVLPNGLEKLKFGYNFNKSLNDVLPINLKHLFLCEKYKKSYSFLKSLVNLTHLEIHVLDNNFMIPPNVTHLKVWSNFNSDTLKYISSDVTKLKNLTITNPKNNTITKYVPSCVIFLSLVYSDKGEELINNIPSTVQTLKINNWKEGIKYELPLFLTKLKLFDTFFDRRFIPTNIKVLKISTKYSYLISKLMRRNMYITYYK